MFYNSIVVVDYFLEAFYKHDCDNFLVIVDCFLGVFCQCDYYISAVVAEYLGVLYTDCSSSKVSFTTIGMNTGNSE